jgi:hypothetical protein
VRDSDESHVADASINCEVSRAAHHRFSAIHATHFVEMAGQRQKQSPYAATNLHTETAGNAVGSEKWQKLLVNYFLSAPPELVRVTIFESRMDVREGISLGESIPSLLARLEIIGNIFDPSHA